MTNICDYRVVLYATILPKHEAELVTVPGRVNNGDAESPSSTAYGSSRRTTPQSTGSARHPFRTDDVQKEALAEHKAERKAKRARQL